MLALLTAILGQTTQPAIHEFALTLGKRIVPLVLAVLVLVITVEMIRRRKLREEYAMIWLGASVVLMVLAIWPDLVIWLQDELGVNYLTIIVMACFLFLAVIVMHLAIVISKQSEEIRQLAQQMAILKDMPIAPRKPADGAKDKVDKGTSAGGHE